MKSITTKLAVAMIGCMFAAVSLVSAIYMNKTLEINDRDSCQIVKLMCEDNARVLDAQLVAIERSVDLLTQHSSFFLYDMDLSFEERIHNLRQISLSTADYTEEAYSVYFHCNPNKYDTSLDFFYVRNESTGKFERGTAYDPYTYERERKLSADWYFASASSREACWLPPYVYVTDENKKEVVVASYTVPLFDEGGDVLGVLGMDYTFEKLKEELGEISLYNTGYAFLASVDGTVVIHPSIPFGTRLSDVDKNLQPLMELMQAETVPEDLFRYDWEGEEKQMTFSVLRNGTYLAVVVPTDEINATVDKAVKESQILFAVVLVSTVMIIYCIVYRFIRPLQLLTYASQQIIKGNMQVDLPYHASDEIGELTENFRKMALFLQEHIARINTMAYTDAMTGLKNKTAYQAATNLLQERMDQGAVDFAIVVFDLNNLKCINDSQGHAAGDSLIKNAGKIICRAFSHSPVFRIGGDEFVVLLENDDLCHSEDCLKKLESINKELNEDLKEDEKISLAYGMAQYEPERDKSYKDVFSRADREMYRHKLAIKKAARKS